jgi:hypothetical protein
MKQEQVLSSENQDVLIGFANKVLPLAFNEVQQAIDKKKRAIIQKSGVGVEGLVGMMNIRVNPGNCFTVDIFMTSNMEHGKTFRLTAWKSGMEVQAYLKDVNSPDLVVVEPESIQELVKFLLYFEDTSEPSEVDKWEAEYFLEHMTEKHEQDLIDRYLETGEFDKIIELQKRKNKNTK